MNVSFFTSCTVLMTGCTLTQDDMGITPVVDGYYSDYTDCFEVVSGVITSVNSCPSPVSGNICGTWQSDAQLNGDWENLTSGSVDFSSVLNLGELITTQIAPDGFYTNIVLSSYKSIQSNTYNVTPTINWIDNSNIVDFSFTKFQGTSDDTPVDTLYFTGTIYTDAGRKLTLDITSQYDSFVPGSPSGGTSYAQAC